jgi:iron complex outermembrane receptor protein
MTSKRFFLAATASLLALTAGLDRASAQSTEAPPNQSPAASGALQEVIVTAQKRSERLQDVPIAVSAITADTALAQGIKDTTDLSEAIPGLEMYPQNVQMSPYIRGIGNKNTSPGDESAAAIYVDGVYIADMAAGMFSLNNIDRVEVLKGPQGTLFGRNAAAGVIQIVTRDPQQTPSMDASVGYGNYNTVESSLYATTGITDKLAADIAVYGMNQGSGWGTNLATGKDAFYGYEVALRSKWQLSLDDTTVTATVDYDRSRPIVPPAFTAPIAGHPYAGGVTFQGFYNTDSNIDVYGDTRQVGSSLQIKQDLKWAELVSITSYRDVRSVYNIDSDGTPALLQEATLYQPDTAWTQEVQLVSPSDSKVKWIAGFFYYNDDAAYTPLALQVKTTKINISDDQTSQSYAAFGQATVPVINDANNITLGLRYTIDDRHIDGGETVNGKTALTADQSANFDKVTWRLSYDHHFTDDILGYVENSSGFKSGVFNTVAPNTPAVHPEIVDDYEIGFKSEFFNHTLRANVAAFYDEIRDMQLQVSAPGGTILLNAAQAAIKGFDLDMEANPISHLSLTGGVEYLDSYYTSFPGAAYFNPIVGGGNVQAVGNATGNALINAPRWTFNLSAQYSIPTEVGDFRLALSDYFNSGYVFDQQARLRQPQFNLVNSSVDWAAPRGNWGVRLWAKNLTDVRYYSNIIPQVFGDTTTPAPPRTFGVTLTAHL